MDPAQPFRLMGSGRRRRLMGFERRRLMDPARPCRLMDTECSPCCTAAHPAPPDLRRPAPDQTVACSSTVLPVDK